MNGFIKIPRDVYLWHEKRPFSRFEAYVYLVMRARLYLIMEPGKCIIRKAKIWRNKYINPNGLETGFKIVNGCGIIPDKAGWRRGE